MNVPSDGRVLNEDEERTSILDTLARLTDRTVRSDAVKYQIEQVHRALSVKLRSGAPYIFEAVGLGLKRCGIALPFKAPMYATLAGLLTVGNEAYAVDMATKLSDAVGKDLAAAIRDGRSSDARRALRFLVCLGNSSMVSPASVAEYILVLLDAALFELTEAKRSPYGVHCRGEFLADIALSCLPWTGPLLAERAPSELSRITESIASISDAWKSRRWRCVASATEERCAEYFSELLDAIFLLRDAGWVCSESIVPTPYKEFELQLGGGHEVMLAKLVIPGHSKLTRYSAPRFRLYLVNDPPEPKKAGSSGVELDMGIEQEEGISAGEKDVVQDQKPPRDAIMSDNRDENDKTEPAVQENGDSIVKREPRDVNMSDQAIKEEAAGSEHVKVEKTLDDVNSEGPQLADKAEGQQDSVMGDAPSSSEPRGDGSPKPPKKNERTAIEKYVLRSYVADVVDNFSTNHVMAAERLLTMPMLSNVNDEIVEGLFSQMCAMPAPSFAPVYYGTLFVDLCQVKDSRLPTKLLTAVERMFQDAGQFDPETFDRLADWFSFHLSNFGYKWNWSDWALYADQDMVDKFPFRALFCKDVLARCIRLSYYDRILKVIPSEMRYFLPPQPGNGNQVRFNEDVNDQLMQVVTGKGKQEASVVKEKLIALIPCKADIEDPEELKKAEEEANLLRLASLMRAILLAGCKTLSHFDTVAERYLPLLMEMSLAGGVAARRRVTIEVSCFWSDVHIRRLYVLDKLSTHRVIDGLAIIDSVTSSERVEGPALVSMNAKELGDSLSQSCIWEIVRLVMSRACAREEGARSELTAASQAAASANEGEIEKAEHRLERAKSGTENAKREISELLLLAFRRLFVLCARLMEENADEMGHISSAEGSGRTMPGFGRVPVWYWRCLGMIRELARKHPRHLSALLGTLETDTKDMRERHKALAESYDIIAEVEASALLPQVW